MALKFDRDEVLGRIAARADVEKDDATAMMRAIVDVLHETSANLELQNGTQPPGKFDQAFDRQ